MPTTTMKPLNPREKIAVCSAAIDFVTDIHGRVTGKDHSSNVNGCKCSYGETIRGLKAMRREAYATAQKTKKVTK